VNVDVPKQLVKARAEGMSEAANSGTDQCMLTVVGLDEDRLESICYKASHSVNNGVCKVANYLFPQGGTVSGDSACVELVQEEAAKAGARKVQRVAVSGAFHTERMALAQEYIKPHVDKIGEPKLRVYSNTTGKPIESAEQARELVLRQIVEPVKWQTEIEAIGAEGMQLYEAGPGQQLKAMTKRISSGLWNSMRNLEV
jgi:[acyl-carrier-protein] S-malonyltransferase